MTEDKHMQKARETVEHVLDEWGRANHNEVEIIATALSEAYRSGVWEEREKWHRWLNDAADGIKAEALAEATATAIRTTKAD